MDISIDLDVTATRLRDNIENFVRVLPDDLLMMGLDHFQHAESISEQDANELVRAGLTGMLIRAHREELRKRLERIR